MQHKLAESGQKLWYPWQLLLILLGEALRENFRQSLR